MPKAQPIRSGLAAALAATATGLLYGLAQPGFGAWPLAALCLVPLLAAMAGRGVLARAGLGWIAGTVATGIATLWPATAGAIAYFGLRPTYALLAGIAVGQVFGAGSFMLFSGTAGDPFRGRALLAWTRICVCWAGAEIVRATLLTGLPWLFLGHALAERPDLIQGARLGGAYLVSLQLAAINAAILFAVRDRRVALGLGGLCTASFALSMAALPHAASGRAAVAGSVRTETGNETPAPGELDVLLVQGNIPNAWRGDPSRIADALGQLVDLTKTERVIDLAIWPENAINFLLPVNDSVLGDALQPLGASPRYLLLGAPRTAIEAAGELRNSATLLGPERITRGHHDKVHLLPFAEYVPDIARAIGIEGSTTGAGAAPSVLDAGGAVLGPLVCFEVAFPEIARAQVRAGATLLVNLSNDAWFGGTGAMEQHFVGAIFRAVETGRPMLRATNTGITAAIDAWGRVQARLPMNVAGVLHVAVVPTAETTLYTRLGDAPLVGAYASVLVGALLETVRARRRPRL